MKGYWNLAESGADTVVDEWFSTGDIGRVDEDGYFFLVAPRTSDHRTSPLRAPGLQSRQAIVSCDIGRGWTLLPGT
jgi:hypothetical protein